VLVSNIAYGKHSALFTLTNYHSVEMPFEVKESGPLLVQTELSIAMAKLSVTGRPVVAEVVVDDESFGSLPVSAKPLKPGYHRVQVRATGYEAVRYDMNFSPDENKNLNVYLQPKLRGKAMLRSLFLPGWGQMYADKKLRTVAYPVFQLTAIGAALWTNSRYNKAIDKFEVAKIGYAEAFTLEDVDQTWKTLGAKSQDIKTAKSQRTMVIGVAVGMWLWNIIDAAIWPPQTAADNESKGIGLSRPQLYCTTENRLVKIGIGLKF
jgi:hypothetical protein